MPSTQHIAGWLRDAREAVVLHYLEELPIAEVAEICGVPPGTIKSRLHRGRRVIRETLTD